MQTKKILVSLVKKYKKLSPEYKIPFFIFFFILVVIIRMYESSRMLTSTAKIKITQLRKRTIQILHKKKHKQPKQRYGMTLATKLKYFSLGIFFSLLFIFFPLITLVFVQDLPNPKELSTQQIPQTTKIYDRNKVLLYEIYSNQNRTLVSLDDIPKYLQQATLAIEDKNFYKHPGFDITSIIRALKENLTEGKPMQGGSTITQQLIKSSLLTSEKKFSRKIKELVLAFWAEHMYSKNQILEMYFNQVPYGGTAWGIEAASEIYFDKSVKQLTLGESAFMAGITQAPSQYSPFGSNPTLWKSRQKDVLSRMVVLGYISEKQAKRAEAETLHFKKQQSPLRAPHFVMYIKDLLIKHHGLAAVEKGGLTVITSLDIKKQEMAQRTVSDEVERSAYLQLTNGALLITNPKNGDILAMVGSKDFNDPNGGNVNVTTALRQPGSTVKVITYSEALLKGLTAASIIDDSPSTFYSNSSQPYTPVNYDGKYFGKVTMRFALANSLNLPAVKTLQQISVSDMVSLAKKMGVTHWDKPDQYGLSVTLGGAETTMLDMATVFGTLSNNGERVDLNPILLVTDAKGTVLEQKQDSATAYAIPTGVSFIISNILSDNITRAAVFGTQSILIIPGHTVSVKTGTSDNKRDNWTIGYTKDYVVTAWVGNNDNSPMSQTLASGITGAAPIWNTVMTNLLKNAPDAKAPVPDDIVVKTCFGKNEYFLRGSENTTFCGASPKPKIFSAN